MSTILKALRRLEQDQPVAENLHDSVVAPPDDSFRTSRTRWLVGSLAAVAALSLAVAAFALWPRAQTETAQAPDEAAAGVVARSETPGQIEVGRPLPARVSPTGESGTRARAATPNPAVRASRRAPARRVVPQLAVPPATPAAEEIPPPPARDPVEVARVEAPEPAPVRTPPAPALEVRPPPRIEPSVEVVERPPPLEILVKRTIWHPTPERREAFVQAGGSTASRRVREGDHIDEWIVSSIQPSRVVFEKSGVSVARRVGER